MKIRTLTLIILILFISKISYSQYDDAVIVGHVVSEGKHLPFVNIFLEGTSLGTATDVTGHFMMVDVPLGEYTIVAKTLGYKVSKKQVVLKAGETVEIKFALEEEVISMDEVVITGTKTFKRQTESAVIVNVLDAKAIQNIAANTVSESLNFQPGLRMETDCQTCNYTQLRMNGLGGAYSQILVNSRAVFSPLTGLYGLEQMPTEMIERIEVVRGGGSALYGSSAIGGTVNIITKFPQRNSYELTSNNSVINGDATDYLINASTTVLSQKLNSGVSIYTSHRKRQAYDHDGDGYSELPTLTNNSFGFNSFYRINENQKLEANFSSLHEYRRGGNKNEEPAYLADQSEERTHYVLMGGIDYEIASVDNHTTYGFYVAGQYTTREHYTGIAPDLADELPAFYENAPYGDTKNYTYQFGVQVNHSLLNFLGGTNLLTIGMEYLEDDVFDRIDAYDYLIDQNSRNFGAFFQSDWAVTDKLTFLAGLRSDKHNYVDKLIVNPRLSFLYKPNSNTQYRVSWASGFRAPQAFDADLHIAFAGGGIQRVELANDLKEERSQSISASINFDKPTEKHIYGFTLEGFYTKLDDAFVMEEISTDADGNSLMEKRNGGTSNVLGTTLELRANYNRKIQFETGITLQKSEYGKKVEWSGELPGIKKYLRTPEAYGYYTLTFTPKGGFKASLSGIYTGEMLVPHYGVPDDAGTPEADILFTSPNFLETNLKLSYQFSFKRLDSTIEIFGGATNLFNKYQDDFDSGKFRDSGYIYGPAKPRSVFFGVKIFN